MPLQDSGGVRSKDGTLDLAEFVALPGHEKLFHIPTRGWWSEKTVNARFSAVATGKKLDGKLKKTRPSEWLREHRCVNQMAWAPGEPSFIEGKLLTKGAWQNHPGAVAVNTYEPPALVPGNAALAEPWVSHVHEIYPEEAGHLIDWLAHRVQRPDEKINHAIVLGGTFGIGKDALLEVLRPCVGPANFQEISPADLVAEFDPFKEAMILRISEAHDTGEGGKLDRHKLHDRTKTLIAAPPDALPINEKFTPR